MRIGCSLLLGLLLGCAPEHVQPNDPIGEPFWITAGGWTNDAVFMYRDGDQIELRRNDLRVALGTLTASGLSAWSDAVASVDPNAVDNLPVCAPSDGVDTCIDVGIHSDHPLGVCYCTDNPPPDVTQLDAYFGGLASALLECETSEHIVIDLCG